MGSSGSPNARRAAPLASPAIDDATLVARVQVGDLEAFRLLHHGFAVDLLDFAFTYLRSREDAEEVVQDLFAWIWEHRHEWDAPGGLRAYLFRAIRNRAISYLRHRRVQARFQERMEALDTPRPNLGPAPATDALASVTAGELGAVLSATLTTLPPRCREVFLLVRERGLSYAEVAVLLGIAPKTVEIHMSHALGVLRRRVAEWRGR